MIAIDRSLTGQALRFEIRSRHHVAGPMDDDLKAVGIAAVDRSRLLLVSPGPDGTTREHVEPLPGQL